MDQMASLENSTKFYKELTSTLLKLFHKIKEERMPPNSFYETSITLLPKPERHYKKTTKQYPL